jgi:tetratricopeptide (TPR) repeat protein
LLFVEGLLRRDAGDAAGAEACLVRLLQTPPGNHFASVDTGLLGYKTRHHLALLYAAQGRLAEAEAAWRAALAERPNFLPAWRGLADLARQQGRWQELAQLQGRLQGEPEAALPGGNRGPPRQPTAGLGP